MSRRIQRVEDQIRAELAHLILHEVADPRIDEMTTVTAVSVSPDLANARVMVSIYGSEEEREESLEGLRAAAGFLRSRLASRLTQKRVPELNFELDRGPEHSARIASILEDLDYDDSST